MTASVGGGQSDTHATSQSSGETGPWAPSVPALTAYLGQVSALPGAPNAEQSWSAWQPATTAYENYMNGPNFGQQVGEQAGAFLGGDPFNLLKSGLSSYQNQLAPFLDQQNLDPGKNPYTASIIDTIKSTIGDQVNAQFAGAGRDLSGMNSGELALRETQALAPVLFGQYNQNVQNMLGSASNLFNAGAGTSGAMSGNVLQGAGLAAAQPSIAVAPAQMLAQMDLQSAMLPYQMAAAKGSLLLPIASAGNTTQQTGVQDSSTNSMNWGVSGGPSSMKSDIRLKRDVAKVGEKNGFNLYRFRYLDDDETYVGVVAQEILAIDPDAVEIGEDGFMRVKYNRIGVPFMTWREHNARAV